MSDAIFNGFIRPLDGFVLPSDFGLYSAQANAFVRDALGLYVAEATTKADAMDLRTFHERLSAFQNGAVKSDRGDYFDDLFGWSNPDSFDAAGHVIKAS